MKRIKELSEIERETLRWAWKEGPTARVRQRAQAIYWFDRNYRRADLGKLFEVDVDTISVWLDDWERDGLRGLYDAPRSGRPPIYSEEEQSQFCQWLEEEPRQRKQAQGRLEQKTGQRASGRTYHRIVKKKVSLETSSSLVEKTS
jgi:transposase